MLRGEFCLARISYAVSVCLEVPIVRMFEIRVERCNDQELVEKWLEVAREVEATNVSFRIGEEHLISASVSEELSERPDYPDLESFIKLEGAYLNAETNAGGSTILLTRKQPFDEVNIRTNGGGPTRLAMAARFMEAIKQIFREVDLNTSILESLSEDQRKYYEAREAALLRLEQLSERMIKGNEEYRQKVDAESLELRASLEDESRKKNELLDLRSSELDKREQDMDLADAKSTRRKMRQDLLVKLQPDIAVDLKRSDTRKVQAIFLGVSVLLLLLSGFIATREGFDLLDWAHALKLGLPVAGLIGTLTLYYRWVDSWIRKGVDEELRLRQLSIDVDRSTWIIEVLSELKEEAADIPEEVLVAITRNLFVGPDPMTEVSHPTEELIRQLLSKSQSAKA